jgi:hypothetical protein
MDQQARPISKRGERNIYCPYYKDCLDYAVECSWPSWNCSLCPHKAMQAMPECEFEIINNQDPSYVISTGVVRGGMLNEFE